jgi:putative transposase
MGTKNRDLFTSENCFFVTTSCFQHKFLLFDETCFEILA